MATVAGRGLKVTIPQGVVELNAVCRLKEGMRPGIFGRCRVALKALVAKVLAFSC
jgi:hypothetical protein